MKVVVVGSGASGVHFALSALEKGHEVVMVDVGREPPPPVHPEENFEELKERLEDPVAHFLGASFEAVAYPGAQQEYYGFPPDKRYVFEGVESFRVHAHGFAPLLSFAQGGLAEAWTGGVFPFNEAELAAFPFSFAEIAPYYDLVAERIGIAGVADDLARHIPLHAHLLGPLELDEHSSLLLARYERRRVFLERALGCAMGRSRIAVLHSARGRRKACAYLGRCLMGCPVEALYTPRVTLRQLLRRERFTYRSGLLARFFRTEGSGRIRALVVERLRDGEVEEIALERLVLAAGTLASSKIFLESWRRSRGQSPRLEGLMDNRQILVPFLTPAMIRRPHDPQTYQYHQIAIGFAAADPADYVHGLVTTLKTAAIHPIAQSIPFDLRTSLRIFRNVHAALGLVNLNFPDRRRSSCGVSLDEEACEAGAGERAGDAARLLGPDGALRIRYRPPCGEVVRLRGALRRLRWALGALGSLVLPGMSHVRPMGASVHYAGTLPMGGKEAPLTTTPEGRSRDFENLWIADASTFPFLPAKNLTFTLMANAARIADRAF